jgi:sn-glycerol 3-phosphate transport system ATP-binding protein
MNFLPGQISVAQRGVLLESGRLVLLANLPDLPDGHLVHLGIRPEHATLVPAGGGTIDAQVDMIEELGASRLCNLMFEDIPICVLTEERPDFVAGATVGLDFPPHRIHLFDAMTGKRIPNDIESVLTSKEQAISA